MPGTSSRTSRAATTAIFVGLILGACATPPPPVDRYTVQLPEGIQDGRARFRDIFCTVLQEHGAALPDYRTCDQALSPVVGDPPGTGAPVDLGPSSRHLIATVVPGIGYSCFVKWLNPPTTGADHLRAFNYGLQFIEVDALSGIETNGRQIRDAIMSLPAESGPPRLVLVGYSKGAPDILEAIVRYPEIRDRVAAVVSAGGAVRGSALADDAKQQQAELLRYWPGADCDEGDGGGVESLRPAVRKAWMAENPLPPDIPYYSLVTLPTPERVSKVIEKSYRKLGEIDWRNDSQVIYDDQMLPGSTLLGFLNADHWAIAVPVNRSHTAIGRTFADQNAYPREALWEAVLRFIEEDLDRRNRN